MSLLGPVGATVDDSKIRFKGGRSRAVLALLALHTGQVLPPERIIDGLWGDDPPRTARNSVQRFVSDLRGALGPSASAVESIDGSYRLDLAPDAVDAHRFLALARNGREALAAGDSLGAAERLTEALALWRGVALDGIGGARFVESEATRLDQARLAAIEDSNQAELALGRHATLLPDLERLTTDHPYRERLWGQLMVALHRSGRQSDAIDAFQRLRRLLVDELGVEPSPELRQLEHQILTHELPGGPELGAAGPRSLRGYELGEILGQGGVGTVYRATQASTGRPVALKVIDADRADDPPFIRDFDAETAGVAALEHPHIVPLYDWWREPSAAYLVMRLLRGGTLTERTSDGSPPPGEAVVDQIGDALRAAHARGIVHGNVGPDRVLFDDRDFAYLGGFGMHDGTVEADLDGLAAIAALVDVSDQRVGDGSPANPYKGLRAFQEADAADFYGRDTLVGSLLERLRTNRFVAVVGPTGSGKSSGVRAGLLPALRRGAIAGSEQWFIVDMVPGASPIDELGQALLQVAVDPPQDLRAVLAGDRRGLATVADLVLPTPESELVLVVDQLEELFTLVPTERARNRFIDALVDAVDAPHSRVRVVVTLRADFYDRPLRYHRFGELFQQAAETVIPLSADEIERAVVGPAARVGVAFDTAVLAELVADVADQPAALPLLQYALTELFERRAGGNITVADYDAVGGVLGALGGRAEDIYGTLLPDEREATRQVFLRLVTLGGGSSDTRRRAPRSELAAVADEEVVDRVLAELGRHRLVTFDRHPNTREPTVEVAHEALLQEWTRLAGWIEASREDLLTHRRLAAACADWTDADSDPSFLLGGSRLDQMLAWAEETDLELTGDERAYLATATTARETVLADERARAAREAELERRAVRRLRTIVAVLAVAAVVAGGLSLFALERSRAADDERDRAEAQARISTARGQAAASQASLASDPDLALLLAIEAVEATTDAGDEPLPAAREALHLATQNHHLLARLGDGTAAVFDPASGRLAIGGDDGTMRLVDPATGEVVAGPSAVLDGPIEELAIDPAGQRAVAAGGREARVVDMGSLLVVATLAGHQADVTSTAFAPDGSSVVTGSVDGWVRRWEPSTGQELAGAPVSGDFTAVAWLPDDRALVAVTNDGGPNDAVVLLDPETVAPTGDRVTGGFPACAIAVAPDGDTVAVAQPIDPPLLLDLTGVQPDRRLGDLTAVTCDVAFSPVGDLVATGSEDGSIHVYSLADTDVFTVFGTDAIVADLAFGPDGRLLASVTARGQVLLWDVEGGGQLAHIPNAELSSVSFTPDGDQVAALGTDGVARLDIDTSLVEWLFDAGGGDLRLRGSLEADGNTFVAPTPLPGSIQRWRLDDGVFLGDQVVAESQVVAVETADSGRLAAAAFGVDSDIAVVDPNGSVVGSYRAEVSSLAVGSAFFDLRADGTLLAAAVGDVVRVWDVESGQVVAELDEPGARVVVWSGSDEVLATSGSRDSVSLWRGDDTFTIDRVIPTAVVPSALAVDDQRLVVGGSDGAVRVIDLADQVTVRLVQHMAAVADVAIDSSGTRIASASSLDGVQVTTLDVEELLTLARQRVTRRLTPAECDRYFVADCDG